MAVAARVATGPLTRLDRLVVLRGRRTGWSTRVHLRSVMVTVALLVLTALVFSWSLAVGDFPVALGDVLASLVGQGSSETDFIVRTLRLPRGLTALLVGAAFGLAGAVFQRIARNPLASPDIVGVNHGAAAAAVFVIVVLHGSARQVTVAALVGALLTGLAVYLLAYTRGVSGYRFVLVGIGVSAMGTSVTSYLLTRSELLDAQRATVWMTGSLNGRGWEHVRPVALALVLLVPLTLALARPLRALELGDDAATGLGARVEPARAALLLSATALAAVGTASAGPVAFVALVSPQIGRRLVGGRSLALVPSALCGALLMVSADLVARRMFAPTELPVGIFTAILGAPYLLFLLARANRIGARVGDVGTEMTPDPTLVAAELRLAYDDLVVVDGLSITIPTGAITVIVGANACGKSTLLRGLARLLKPRSGAVLLDGEDIHRLPTRAVATRLGILPQQPIAPEGITVADLVGRGRHPHQRWLRQFSSDDEAAVDAALEATGIADLAERSVDELSGGQRQRVWIALALAQGTPLMLLDEPTTFLDLAHQVEVLDLLAELNEREGRTVVLVLHDLNLACRYAHHLVAMKAGTIVAEGHPGEVVTEALVDDVFGLSCRIIDDPVTGTPLVLPISARTAPVSGSLCIEQ